MDCIVDFCIGCDKTAVDGVYCSEKCRLADLERSGSVPSSPSHHHADHPNPFYTICFNTNFSLISEEVRLHRKRDTTQQSSYSSPHRDLSPASSRCSALMTPHAEPASEETAKELMNYFNAFDRTRELRRRSVPGTRLPQPDDHRPRQNSH